MMMDTGRVAAAAAALLLACAVARAADAPDLQESARGTALHELLQQIRALQAGPERTVGAVLDEALAGGADIPWSALVGGVEEERPARFYGTGECEVVLRLDAERLRANLAEVFKTYASKADVDASAIRVPGPYLAARGRSVPPFSWREAEKLVYGPPGRLEGWSRVDALDRAKAERAARDQALDRLRGAVGALFQDAPGAAEAVNVALGKVLPYSKAYLNGGVVEVKYVVSAEDLVRALRPDPADPEAHSGGRATPAGASEEISRRLAGRTFTAVAYADAKGQPVEPSGLFRFEPVPPSRLPDVLPKPAPATTAPPSGEVGAPPEPPRDAEGAP